MEFNETSPKLKRCAEPQRTVIATPASTPLTDIPRSNDDISQTCAVSHLSDVLIKAEPIDPTYEPQLIDERLYDEHIFAQTGNEDDGVCGRVLIDKSGSKTLKIKCSQCSIEFNIANWPSFVKHLEDDHKIEYTQQPAAQPPIEATVDKIGATGFSIKLEEDVIPKSIVSYEDTSQCPISSFLITELDENAACEEKNTKRKASTYIEESSDDDIDVNKEDDNPLDCKDPEFPVCSNKETSSKKKIKVESRLIRLSLTTPNVKLITDFLEIIKSLPILWHRRQSIMKPFDAALTDLCKQINDQYHMEFTEPELREAIGRFKVWYQRCTDESETCSEAKRADLKAKNPEYFELCAMIDQNSKKIVHNCDLCTNFFFTEIDLQIHKVKRHRVGELPYKCQYCSYRFSNETKLSHHELKHEERKRFACELCSRTFSCEQKLTSHMNTHTDGQKRICEVCGKKVSNYKRHILKHEDPKLSCQICGKLFYEKWVMSEHVKSHLNNRLYSCDLCGKTFNQQQGVRIHKKNVHKVEEKKKFIWVNKEQS